MFQDVFYGVSSVLKCLYIYYTIYTISYSYALPLSPLAYLIITVWQEREHYDLISLKLCCCVNIFSTENISTVLQNLFTYMILSEPSPFLIPQNCLLLKYTPNYSNKVPSPQTSQKLCIIEHIETDETDSWSDFADGNFDKQWFCNWFVSQWTSCI